MQYYDRTSDLKNLGFEIGVAISNVSNEFPLDIKIGENTKIYKNDEDISFALKILNICFKKASDTENTFWQAYSEVEGLDIIL